ncbi:hypothetical protein P4E94_19525 [Pontiellaceae bacterium B12219]|nr:hypothetical protein [Pontiellaceae bacterium B12219]
MTIIKSKLRYILCLAASFISLSTSANSNHLEPLPFIAPSPVITSLLHGTSPKLWMIVLPSSSTQHAVILDEEIEYKETVNGEYEITNRQLFIKYASFKQRPKIKRLTDRHVGKYEDINISDDIEHYELHIDEGFASIIEEAWASVLIQTKYPENWGYRLGGGTTYIFNCERYYGKTTSPKSGSPAMLVELGSKLRLLARSSDKDRDAMQNQCIEIATKILEQTNPNQELQPTVKTPVKSGNEQGTAAEL